MTPIPYEFILKTWPNSKILREQPVSITDNGITVHGFTDLVLDMGKGYILLDYKTVSGNKNIAIKKGLTYAAQQTAYAEAWEQAGDKKVLGIYLVLPLTGTMIELKLKGRKKLLQESVLI